jgi:hypothetical protein
MLNFCKYCKFLRQEAPGCLSENLILRLLEAILVIPSFHVEYPFAYPFVNPNPSFYLNTLALEVVLKLI